ncbi:MAG: hypothetical protein GXP55_10770, partial [Deltaproteobacteria bacterium]|nr:hypothetical protein [Deltaproteobacteria bacterium]
MKWTQISGALVSALLLTSACGGGGGNSDAGADASDARADAPMACVVDADCDDGLFCDGVETCREGFCEVGARPDCDDSDACTTDTCDEDRDECVNTAPDADGDGHAPIDCGGDDCDDDDANRFPGNVEVCDTDNHDEDCDATSFGAEDRDGDGFLDARCCNTDAAGVDICGDDCDDVHAGVHPTATETCDGFDNDCNGEVDEGVTVTVYPDTDFDGHGDDGAASEMRCPDAVGFSVLNDDCDDTNPTVYTGQVEICDALDNDCDGVIDDSPIPVTWYRDADGDGFGSAASGSIESCAPIAGYTLSRNDCDDASAAINPAAAELCDGRDNNCNGVADFLIGLNDYEDDDNDGIPDIACGAPLGLDCDDADPITGGGQPEVCDGRDNNCNGEIDEGAMDRQWFRDADGDGYGSITSGTRVGCMAVPGFIGLGGDCNDADPARYPGAPESCNGIDDDCDGSVDGAAADAECVVPNAAPACVVGRCRVATCADGFGDCDGDPANGCEVTLSDTADHCGSCDVACTPGHGSASCVASACVFGACDPGYADCDADEANGCETATTADIDNCGGCGSVCDFADASASCVAGACTMNSCDFGFEDCNADPSDGCEVEPRTAPMNCGACGTVCDGARLHTTAVACSFGRCAIDDAAPACELGWADCDANPFNGCETPTDRDPNNCGGCGMSCDVAGGIGCSASACVFNRCAPGFDDCDGDAPSFAAGNGCETPVDSDPGNCGRCGNSCGALANAVGGCSFGRCSLSSCVAGFEDCDGVVVNGCEADTSSPNSCGGCGNDCTRVPNVTATNCTLGTCSVASCSFGWADCDGDPFNGCETDTNNDLVNCGGCRIPCNPANGVGVCASGTCQSTSCNFGWEDCDGMPSTGCETNIDNDPANCGRCGEDCTGGGSMPGSTCTAGVCNLACPPGMMDCNNNPGDGCETDTDNDPLNCGGCDTPGAPTACPPAPNGIPICNTGSCGLICNPGFDDCDLLPSNGCEIDTNNDPMNCSFCGNKCLLANATSACNTGTCEVNVCNAGYGDCDGLTSTGCETGTDSDPLNCGGCGIDCGAAGVCSGGLCDDVIDISVGQNHSCAVRALGALVCWGDNTFGQLGVPSTTLTSSNVPVDTGLTGMRSVSAGGRHSCAVSASTGDVYCWGDDSLGALGTPGISSDSGPGLVDRVLLASSE